MTDDLTNSDSSLRATIFVQTDVTSWEEQLNACKVALTKSPSRTLDIFVANAGITTTDSLFENDSKVSKVR